MLFKMKKFFGLAAFLVSASFAQADFKKINDLGVKSVVAPLVEKDFNHRAKKSSYKLPGLLAALQDSSNTVIAFVEVEGASKRIAGLYIYSEKGIVAYYTMEDYLNKEFYKDVVKDYLARTGRSEVNVLVADWNLWLEGFFKNYVQEKMEDITFNVTKN